MPLPGKAMLIFMRRATAWGLLGKILLQVLFLKLMSHCDNDNGYIDLALVGCGNKATKLFSVGRGFRIKTFLKNEENETTSPSECVANKNWTTCGT